MNKMTALAVILGVVAALLTIAAFWWWALFGMSQDVGLAWTVTVFILGIGCPVAAGAGIK